MLKLGHIEYSNCIPVHGRFLVEGAPAGVTLVRGVPGELNRKLENGTIDVAPASSIEFARHSDRYRVLPGLSISAPGSARTIQLLTRPPLDVLSDGVRVALPTASATSVALVKIIMSQRIGINPEYEWFEQETEDPLAAGADAALYIGDLAQRQVGRPDLQAHDLGALWREWTGHPFVFALWQTSAGPERAGELDRLASELIDSREWSSQRLPQLAERFAGDYGWTAEQLMGYWGCLTFGWDDALAAGLDEFYRRSAEVGVIERAPESVFQEP
jgi:chorismate dehydratase